MHHIRIFRQYIPVSLILLALMDYLCLFASVYVGRLLRFYYLPNSEAVVHDLAGAAHLFAAIMLFSMLAMGAYRMKGTEGLTGLVLRTMVSLFLVGIGMLSVVLFLLPYLSEFLGRGVLAISCVVALILLTILRVLFFRMSDLSHLRRRVLIMGAGDRAMRLTRKIDTSARREIEVASYYSMGNVHTELEPHKLIQNVDSLFNYCRDNKIQEIVVAADDRRRSGNSDDFPLDQLLDCKLSGIAVLDELVFCERELGIIDTRSLSPGWMVFANGFSFSPYRDFFERLFDLTASSVLLLVTWPIMLIAAIAIKLEDGWRAPLFYSQERVGYKGRSFFVHKFRSMRTDAEKDGKAVWAQKNDTRITRVGNFIRNTRIDELPQIFNVFKGEMSFVGPRPERPQFVDELGQKIPFYHERHRVKPGITGWAQLLYPYGASEEDAEQKLRYDLYYVKNHSIFLDFYILVRTIEVVLLGNGVR